MSKRGGKEGWEEEWGGDWKDEICSVKGEVISVKTELSLDGVIEHKLQRRRWHRPDTKAGSREKSG